MKKIVWIIGIGTFLFLFWGMSVSFADDATTSTTITVTEAIPGLIDSKDCTGSGPTDRKCTVTIKSGFGSVMDVFGGLIKYATFITALVGVLMLVVSGIQYSMAGANQNLAKEATERIGKVIMGLVLLFLIGFVLNSVAPWIYK